jgi:hypothetical protein
MFCYPSLLSHVLLEGQQNTGDQGGIAKHRRRGRDSKTRDQGGIAKHGREGRDSKTQEREG